MGLTHKSRLSCFVIPYLGSSCVSLKCDVFIIDACSLLSFGNGFFCLIGNGVLISLHSRYEDQSYGIAESEPLIHFSFLAVDSIVDVIAAYEPKIKITR